MLKLAPTSRGHGSGVYVKTQTTHAAVDGGQRGQPPLALSVKDTVSWESQDLPQVCAGVNVIPA